ncbi:hypothetical protein KR093_007545, partial [Drosophila rubida]
WKYEPIYINTYSNDESQLNISARLQRSAHNDLSIGMDIDWMYDTNENDTFEMQIFRSPHGNLNEYMATPIGIPKMSLEKALSDYYEKFVYPACAHCSNMLKYADLPNGKLAKQHYVFDHCVVNYKVLPHIMPEGTYKIVIMLSHDFEWGFEIVAKVTPKIL